MQGPLDGDNSAGARKALAKVQKMLQLVSTKRHALALRDYRETLDECLKTEASSTMKILGYRMAARVPTCTTHEVWQMLLDASVSELASSQNGSVLLYSIPILEQIPLPLVLGFLIASEREPMNKLRAVLQHEQSDVRCCAIASLAKVTLEAAVAVANDGLFAFPFESHESRIVCQQDLWTIITDVWKIIFQSLSLEGTGQHHHDSDVAGTAFAAMRMLFAKTAAMVPFQSLHAHGSPLQQHTAAHAAANDLAASVYKEAFPRIRLLVQCAQRLPMKYQVDAAWWLSMLLSMMMDRSGAKCAGLSVAYLEIDVVKTNSHEDDDDDDSRASTERVRVDQFCTSVLESWLLPLMGRKIPLAQSVALCRAVFIVLSHPLQAFARLKAASTLVQQLIAQCYFHKSTDVKLEMSNLLVRAFSWVSSTDCLALFPRVIEAVHLMERETDRHDLLQLVMDGIRNRVLSSRDFLLLESIAAMEIFRQPSGTSKLSPRTSGSHVYRALVQSLLLPVPDQHTLMELQVAQLIVLKGFIQVLLYKTNASVFLRPQHDDETHDVMCYVALLSDHYQNMLRKPSLTLRESLQFYQHDLQRAWRQITSCVVRLQLLRIGIQLHERYQTIPIAKLVELLKFEVSQSFSSGEDEREFSADSMAASSSSAMFDDGKLGGGSIHGAIYGDMYGSSDHRDEHSVTLAVAISDIFKAIGAADGQYRSELQEMQGSIRSYFTTHVSSSSLQSHILEEPLGSQPSVIQSIYAFEIFQPERVFPPPRVHTSALVSSSWRNSMETRPPLLLTGSADPLTLHVSYQQPAAGHEDVVMLSVSCCNTSNMPLSDFEIHIRPRGPVRCIDPSNDLKIRIQQGGTSTSSGLPPYGTLKAEKRFLVQRFAQALFYLQVVYHEADSSGGGDEPITIRVAPSTPFTVNFDALFRCPGDTFTSPFFFQQIWHIAEDSTVFDVSSSHDGTRPLSRGQCLLKGVSSRVAVIPGLLVDLPMHTQLCFLTKTRWDEFVAFSLTLTANTPNGSSWSGICEVRSSKNTVYEMAKQPADVLTILCGAQARVAKPTSGLRTFHESSGSRTASRTASRPVSYQPAAASIVDPFGGGAAFPSVDLSSAHDGSGGTSKWDGGLGFGTDQVRPTEPAFDGFGGGGFGEFGTPSNAAFGATTTTDNSDPWGFA